MDFLGKWLKSYESIQNSSDHKPGLQLLWQPVQLLSYCSKTSFNHTHTCVYAQVTHTYTHTHTHTCTWLVTPDCTQILHSLNVDLSMEDWCKLGHTCATMLEAPRKNQVTELDSSMTWHKIQWYPQATNIQYPNTYIWSQTLLQSPVIHFISLQKFDKLYLSEKLGI